MLVNEYQSVAGFQVNRSLYQFIGQEVLPGLNIEVDDFFPKLLSIFSELTQQNQALLLQRDQLQSKIDQWHQDNAGAFDLDAYQQFLQDIGYLLPKPAPFELDLGPVDDEIAHIAGPQLVVPISSARFALNALNARWGSLYDTLYGSDVIDKKIKGEERAAQVINWTNTFLDESIPLKTGSYAQVVAIDMHSKTPVFILADKSATQLENLESFVGNTENSILIKHHNLHIELVIDPATQAVQDVILESALTTIIDFEDSVATVGSEEKISAYRNFLGLMKRDLEIKFCKGEQTVVRKINTDKTYADANGDSNTLSGSSLMLVRNVGHHMLTDLIKTPDNQEVPEGILDAMVTTLIALHDIKNLGANSKKGNVYIVKPKMHGPDEVAFSIKLFEKVEQALGLNANTLKIGIMDEERRTSTNLAACIKVAAKRVIFINTGFLDRTGDEIHTSMQAGVMLPKSKIKSQPWIKAYEVLNVQVGLNCGMYKQAQIGKGMWAQPDQMREMLESKLGHLQAGANCAWVPSPTAATLHATHYHRFDVFSRQQQLMQTPLEVNEQDLLLAPVLDSSTTLSMADIQTELNNNAQSILGYVVRWIDQGVGCSKVMDIDQVGLMEDRATLRISSQHMANWLHHEICSKEQIERVFKEMALVVDEQNQHDPLYQNMAPSYNGTAFKAALSLVYRGVSEPNGYTEAILKEYRQKRLAELSQ
ncbi:malate synthase G [Candidatus Thioglobus autotrophicus]|uniref:malate synthase G n=1 Tax=Candidatus Thioglobus autotrophicus TaxID=1705394 RepID=UPI00299F4EAC|nr:malate synthase G [Candidatus Thioglobus autotrophicus]WPE16217.1 malate synthase G [Candidatus Thioglobus autotrophicus]